MTGIRYTDNDRHLARQHALQHAAPGTASDSAGAIFCASPIMPRTVMPGYAFLNIEIDQPIRAVEIHLARAP